MRRQQLTRRGVLASAALAALAGACSSTPPPGRSWSTPDVGEPAAARDARELIDRPSFVVAHRGSGDNWPEHTLTAYQNALAAGADAVEISVCATSDGVLICHHDTTAKRVLGVDQPIAELSWAQVQELSVDARRWLGPETPLEPVSRLEDVLGALGDEVLAFVEDKQGTNTRALLDMLDEQPRARERFVWKQWAGAAQIAVAKERGYLAWGYLDAEPSDRLSEFADTFDILGVPMAMRDTDISEVIATGVPVMAWEVHLHDDVERLDHLGVAGLMCSNVEYIRRARALSADTFASGRRAAGDLPADFDRIGWASQPALVPERGALRIQRTGVTSYLMGSLARPGASLRELEFSMMWREAVPPQGGAGVVLALTGDTSGGDADRGGASGYELYLGTTGLLTLSARDEGRTTKTLSSAQLTPPQVGAPVSLRVTLDDGHVRVMPSDSDDMILEAADDRWRGPWVRLFKDYETSQAVEFSAVRTVLA